MTVAGSSSLAICFTCHSILIEDPEEPSEIGPEPAKTAADGGSTLNDLGKSLSSCGCLLKFIFYCSIGNASQK